MNTSVKDLLNQKLPPTRPDQLMTKKHTGSSVDHNIRHFSDHGKGAVEAIGKMHNVDSKASHAAAMKVLAEIDKVRSDIEKLLHKKGC